jgi:hypothetical protein
VLGLQGDTGVPDRGSQGESLHDEGEDDDTRRQHQDQRPVGQHSARPGIV